MALCMTASSIHHGSSVHRSRLHKLQPGTPARRHVPISSQGKQEARQQLSKRSKKSATSRNGSLRSADGSIKAEISKPTDLQTTNPFIGFDGTLYREWHELAALLSHREMRPGLIVEVLKADKDRDSRRLSVRISHPCTSAVITIPPSKHSSDTERSAKQTSGIKPRDSSEVEHARRLKRNQKVHLALQGLAEKPTTLTPRQSSRSLQPRAPDERVAIQHWNNYFSPDGTVRHSRVHTDSATLPRSIYTGSEYAYHCVSGDIAQPEDQLDTSKVPKVNGALVNSGYDHAFGYLPFEDANHAISPIAETPYTGSILIGMVSDAAAEPPTFARARPDDFDSRPSPLQPQHHLDGLAELPEDNFKSFSLLPAIRLLSPLSPSFLDEHHLNTTNSSDASGEGEQAGAAHEMAEIESALPMPLRVGRPRRVRNVPSPVGRAVLARARTQFQRSASKSREELR